VWVGSHPRWLQIGLRPWITEAAANLQQQRRQQHWQLRHWLMQWRWQCGSGSGGLPPNGRGSRARPGRGRRCDQASPSRLALCPRGSGFELAACATPSRLALRPCGLGFALAACATRSRLGLRPRGSRYALAAQAAAAAAVAAAAVEATAANACPCGSRYALAGSGFALAVRLHPLRPRGSRSRLAARATRSRLGFAQTQQSNSKAAAAKAASAALPPICRSGSGWRQQC
jgi:hypothetical protein